MNDVNCIIGVTVETYDKYVSSIWVSQKKRITMTNS
jgi:hypothetical protein